MGLRRITPKITSEQMIKVVSRIQVNWVENLRKIIASEFSKNAKAWRLEAKRLLSGNCARKSGGNSTLYPGRCSGALENSLKHRTYVTKRKNTVSSRWGREFTGVYNSKQKDYGKILNSSSASYGGYQERIYKALDDRMYITLRKYNKTDIGRKAWQRT